MTTDERIGHGEKLTRSQENLIAALLVSPSVQAAAKSANVSESTAHRWMRLPAFKEAYREARREGLSHAIALLQRNAGAAVAAILRNLAATAKPEIQLRAAELTLKFAHEGIELEDLSTRVAELEAAMQAQNEGGSHRYAA